MTHVGQALPFLGVHRFVCTRCWKTSLVSWAGLISRGNLRRHPDFAPSPWHWIGVASLLAMGMALIACVSLPIAIDSLLTAGWFRGWTVIGALGWAGFIGAAAFSPNADHRDFSKSDEWLMLSLWGVLPALIWGWIFWKVWGETLG